MTKEPGGYSVARSAWKRQSGSNHRAAAEGCTSISRAGNQAIAGLPARRGGPHIAAYWALPPLADSAEGAGIGSHGRKKGIIIRASGGVHELMKLHLFSSIGMES